ncbi:trans-1,2-dihydrobenzene-1,2-diol dehydrogenase-like [Chrysoperla carnea]|uniref:trans-1,2-dihydrobenzene-1,2-diol dehydrogenase-like n=1 Tax=Chrysoperla carnea TaxID=189513 RepID=UPI001D07AC46|nr:trans-1,2-dihydrobenzene-1,2-diol dehydrogenase-like [Chrysoperla carnea]
MSTLRWGIVSAGKISHDFTSALSTLPESEHKVVAVAARDLSRAKEFAKVHGIPNVYDNYEALAKDSGIDIAYIGSLNPQHYENAKLMLENGKHVLCEKPLTMNASQTKALIKVAKEKKLFLMEAVWSRCFPVYKELKKALCSGVIGDVKQVTVGFGFRLEHVDRLMKKEMGGGTILDLGIYTLQFQQFIYDHKKPLEVQATGHVTDTGCDIAMNAVIKYENNQLASIQTSGLCELTNEAVIVGTKGIIRVPNFWCPTQLMLPNETKEFPLPKCKHEMNFVNSVGLRYEAAEARECISKGLQECPSITWNESIQLAELEDTLRKILGVKFPEDSQTY